MTPTTSVPAKFLSGYTRRCVAILVIVILCAAAGQGGAAVINARSASRADVGAAVTLAQDGDTIIVPAGTVTWTSGLEITKNVTLQGAGAGSTVVINGIAGGGGRPALIGISLNRDLPFRMTGFTFRRGTASTAKRNNGEVIINGNSHSFRIDHCTFDQLDGLALNVSGFLWGVIDNCRFNTLGDSPIHVQHRSWNGGEWGHGSWADDPYWGSEKFIFIESNVFENVGAAEGSAIDGYEGARFVVRYNQFHNCGVTTHGTEGQGRGAKQVEEYNNKFVFDSPAQIGHIRSGCVITHNNTFVKAPRNHVLKVYRYYHNVAKWGIVDGQNDYDLNVPAPTNGYWEKGTHTGASGASTLTDSTKNWANNQWYVPGVSYILRNITKEAAGSDAQSWVLSNTANTITYSDDHFGSIAPLTFNKGDTYQIWKVARVLDQAGAGKGALLTGMGTYGTSSAAKPAAWPNQVTEPCYSWNNTEAGQARNLTSNQPSIKEGRDFFNGAPKPGYTPYRYPHPLVSGAVQPAATPAPPTNLQIVPGT